VRPVRSWLRAWVLWTTLAAVVGLTSLVRAQNCQISGELDDATRSAITAAGQRYFDMASKGDAAALRQSAIPSLASDFSGIETTVKDHQQDLAGAQSTAKALFLLDAQGAVAIQHAEFYCGVFGKNGQTSGSAVFYFDNLPPGKYAVMIFDATSPQARANLSVVAEQTGADWKLAGLYFKPILVAGHDSAWFAARAR